MPPKSGRRRVAPWVGPWLRERRGTDIDMDSIAKRLRRSKSAVSRIETGDALITADDLPLILKAYGVPVEDFSVQAKSRSRAA